MLSDRRAAIEGIGMPFADGLAHEAKLGVDSLVTGAEGAKRFAGRRGPRRGRRGRVSGGEARSRAPTSLSRRV